MPFILLMVVALGLVTYIPKLTYVPGRSPQVAAPIDPLADPLPSSP